MINDWGNVFALKLGVVRLWYGEQTEYCSCSDQENWRFFRLLEDSEFRRLALELKDNSSKEEFERIKKRGAIFMVSEEWSPYKSNHQKIVCHFPAPLFGHGLTLPLRGTACAKCEAKIDVCSECCGWEIVYKPNEIPVLLCPEHSYQAA